MSDERINSFKPTYHSITPRLNYYGNKERLEFNGNCLKQDSVTFNRGKPVKIYIIYEITKSISISYYPTLENCFLWAVTFTKNG